MTYSRTLLKGYSGPIRKLIAQELGITKAKRHHKHKAIERRRHHHMAKAKLGSGGRFAAFTRRLEGKGMSAGEAKAVAADEGRKKYGKTKMAKMSAIGRRRAAANDNDGDE